MLEDQMIHTDEAVQSEPIEATETAFPDGGAISPTPIVEEGWSVPHPSTPNFATLVVKRGGAETEVKFPISPPAIIGRFDPAIGPIDVDLGNLPEGSYVSRKHAKIICDEQGWKIQDMGSSNGTFVLKDDFEKVSEAEIQDGTEIALGNARFVFHLSPPEP